MSAFAPVRSTWRTLLRIALRDLRGGLSGFWVFLACLALGVMAIAGIGSLSQTLQESLSREGTVILGGDASFSVIQREATDAELARLGTYGRVSAMATMRAMARTASGDSTLVDLKAVDGAYPLAGTFEASPAGNIADMLAERDGAFGLIADPVLLTRLGVRLGDRLRIGEADFVLRSTVVREPDSLSAGMRLGARVIVSREGLAASGLLQPGSLVRWTYRVMTPDRSDAAVEKMLAETKSLGEVGFETRSRADPAPQIERHVNRFTQFLTIVGLTALIVGGVGVANAVNAYVDRKRDVIATFKCLGASGRSVFAIFLIEIAILALAGIAIGLAAGASFPFLVAGGLQSIMPLPIVPSLSVAQLALAAGYGILTVLAFALWPLGRVQDVPVALLYRERVDPSRAWPRLTYAVLTGLCAVALVALSIYASQDRRIALIFAASAVAAFIGLRLIAFGIMRLAAALPRPAWTELRLALVNLYRPGALTPSVVLSLGLGLTLLVALALTDAAVRQQLDAALPAKAPSFFLLDVPANEGEQIAGKIAAVAPGSEVERVPMLRGTIVRLSGVPTDQVKVAADAEFAIRGDRGVTYSTTLPPDSTVVAGQWWAPDHTGSNLVSFEDKLANGLGLKIGDTITVNVLGRNIEATVASLRKVEWKSLGINFFMVFSPNVFAGAPHMDLATVTFPPDRAADEPKVADMLARDYPAIATVRVRDALVDFGAIFASLSLGIRAASSVTVIASILVLGGALAAGHRQRLYDAVVLKTLGATRGRLLLAFALEYGLTGLMTAVFGLIAGAIAAWWITTQIMDIPFVLSWAAPAAALGALALTVFLGLAGSWRVLGAPPARHLRNQ